MSWKKKRTRIPSTALSLMRQSKKLTSLIEEAKQLKDTFTNKEIKNSQKLREKKNTLHKEIRWLKTEMFELISYSGKYRLKQVPNETSITIQKQLWVSLFNNFNYIFDFDREKSKISFPEYTTFIDEFSSWEPNFIVITSEIFLSKKKNNFMPFINSLPKEIWDIVHKILKKDNRKNHQPTPGKVEISSYYKKAWILQNPKSLWKSIKK